MLCRSEENNSQIFAVELHPLQGYRSGGICLNANSVEHGKSNSGED